MITVHVYPENDIFPHILDGIGCPCRPEIRDEDGGTVIVHHSYDGRERADQETKSA